MATIASAKKKPALSSKRTSKSPQYVSFRISKTDRPFISFELTRQSFYWFLLSLVILLLGLYIIFLHVKIVDMYHQLDAARIML
ncbi:MAG: hypothetical protein JWM00_523 [Candidatus Saccharibacteria bacterium]|nr:hypothetical protein [Candidatus Saccharibacteria bacterium]